MRFMKKIVALCAVICMALAFSACSASSVSELSEMVTPPSQTDVLEEARNTLETAQNYQAFVTASSTATHNGVASAGKQTAQIAATETPFVWSIEMENAFDGYTYAYSIYTMQAETESDTKAQAGEMSEENAALMSVYMAYDGQWSYQQIDRETMMQSLQGYDVKKNVLSVLNSTDQWQKEEMEDGSIIYRAEIPAEAVVSLADEGNYFYSMGMANLPTEYYEGAPSFLAEVRFSSDDTDSFHVTLYLEDVLQTLVDHLAQQLSGDNTYEVESFQLEYTVSNMNRTTVAPLPKEAAEESVDYRNQIMLLQEAAENEQELDKDQLKEEIPSSVEPQQTEPIQTQS